MTIEYDQLGPNGANFVAFTPLSFLQRTADIYPQRESLIYNQRRYTWAQTRNRCTRIASSLAARGIGKNDTVSLFAFNTPEMFESHFSIPMAGAVLNTINTRLDAATVAYIIDHGESKVGSVLSAALGDHQLPGRGPRLLHQLGHGDRLQLRLDRAAREARLHHPLAAYPDAGLDRSERRLGVGLGDRRHDDSRGYSTGLRRKSDRGCGGDVDIQ